MKKKLPIINVIIHSSKRTTNHAQLFKMKINVMSEIQKILYIGANL